MVNSLEVVAKNKKIIIADDDPSDVELLIESLEDRGYAPIHTTNPQEVPLLLEREGARKLITDYDMPQMNGEELAYMLKAKYELGKTESGLTIVLRTGRKFDVQKALQLQRDGILYASKMDPDEKIINLLESYRRAA